MAVPIDISAIDATLRFDGTSRVSTGDATLRFEVGPTSGFPIFDLRQHITAAWLDGAPIPVEDIRTVDLGGGPGAQLRVLAIALRAHSHHVLRLAYRLGLPDSPPGGSYPPAIEWADGPRLQFNFGFTDLAPARYLESWIPANLIFDQFALTIDVAVTGTQLAHEPITNGAVTVKGPNHWSIAFPVRFTALSPLLELRATDTLVDASTAVVLPGSDTPVTVRLVKLRSNPVDLSATLPTLTGWLQDNVREIGRYAHRDRFLAFLIRGGMEYDGACTAEPETLRHEAFHSWWGRGVKPAGQADGWWDEGWNVYHDNGASATRAFDTTEPPRALATRNPYSRVTPAAAYTDGERFFEGVAARLGADVLGALMSRFYRDHLTRPTTTEALEAHLVSRSGAIDVVDDFHHWVFGFAQPDPGPVLALAPAPASALPDVWIRHHDDGGTAHQHPIAGRMNWLFARVANHGPAPARHFVVTFRLAVPRRGRFVWPGDYLPSATAAVGFELAAGGSAVVKAALPASFTRLHSRPAWLLAAAYTPGGPPATAARPLGKPITGPGAVVPRVPPG